jgi:DNA-binding beta-propeller fold protein YncE
MKTISFLFLSALAWASLPVSSAYADLFVVDSSTLSSVKRYDEKTGAFLDDFVRPRGGGLLLPTNLVFGPDGDLYVASGNIGPGSIKRYDGTTGTFLGDFVMPSGGGLQEPEDVIFGSNGDFYVLDFGIAADSSVKRYDGITGAFMGTLVPPGSGGLNGAEGFLFGPDGNFYVASRNTSSVKRYDGTTGTFLGDFVTPGSGDLNEPVGLTFGPDGNLYLSSFFSVKRYDGITGQFLEDFVASSSDGLSPGPSGLHRPFDLVFGPDGDLYVSDLEAGAVKRYDGESGAFLGDFVGADPAGVVIPAGLAFTPSAPPVPVPEPGSLSLLSLVAVPLLRRALHLSFRTR